jgi:glycosyltransferase involved in cell wall biosynthesis
VVIPAFRAERTIRRAVDSLLAQTDVEPDVVVVMEGRLDGTEAELADYPRDRVRVLLNPAPEGPARARNRGLSAVQSPYVMFLDADDFVEGPLIAGLLGQMKAESADVGFGPMQILDEWTGERHSTFMPDFSSAEDALQGWHVGDRYVSPCAVLWNAEFLRSIGAWDPEITRNDDGELVMRAILKGARFVKGTQGRGIYVKHSRETLSNRTDVLESLLAANEKLLAIQSDAVTRSAQVHVCAAHYFKIAWQCFYAGQGDLGREALKRSRSLGFSGTLGPVAFRLAARVLGVRSAARLAKLRRRIVGFPRGQVLRSSP